MPVVSLYLIVLVLCDRLTLSEEAPGPAPFSCCELILWELWPLLSRPSALGLNPCTVYPPIFVLYQKVLLLGPSKLFVQINFSLSHLTAASILYNRVQENERAEHMGFLVPDEDLSERRSGSVGKVFGKGLSGHAGEDEAAARECSSCRPLKKAADAFSLSMICASPRRKKNIFGS